MSFWSYVPYLVGGGMIVIGMTLIALRWAEKNKAKTEAKQQDLKIGESGGGHNYTYADPESVKEKSETEEKPTETTEEKE